MLLSNQQRSKLVGTAYKKGDNSLLERFKYEISRDTANGMTFYDIIEIFPNINDKEYRVLMFQSAPSIMWRLYGADGMDRDYAIFKIPFINIVDKVFAMVRNLTYRYMPNQMTQKL